MIDKFKFENKSGKGCSNSHYSACRTSCCGLIVVEDIELHDLYFDSRDLRNVIQLYEKNNCPVCGSPEFELVDSSPSELRASSWIWACKQKIAALT